MAKLDPKKAKVKTTWAHKGAFLGADVDRAGKRAYAASDDFGIHVFDLEDEKKKEPLAVWTGHESYVSTVVCREQGGRRQVISGAYDRQLTWWDPEAGKPVRSLEGHAGWIREIILSPDGSQLISAGDDMLVKVWEADSGKPIRALEGHARETPQGHVTALYAVAVSPDGKYVASGDRIGDVRVWELATGKLAASLQVPILYTYDPRQRKRSLGGIRALAFSRDGKLLAVGGMGQVGNVDGLAGPVHVEVWDWQAGKQKLATGIQKQNGYVNDLIFHPTEPWLIGGGGGGNGMVIFWQIDPLPDLEKDKKATVPDHWAKQDGHIHQIRLLPGDRLLAAGYRKLEVWTLG